MPEFDEVKDSGVREDFASGSVRDSREGKGRYDLISPYATRRLARHFEAGAAKYGDNNWTKGQPISRYLDSALRHINNYLEGQRDEDHIIAAAWNILAVADHEERFEPGHEVFDLPWQKQMYEEAARKGYVVEAVAEKKTLYGPDNPCDYLTCYVCHPEMDRQSD